MSNYKGCLQPASEKKHLKTTTMHDTTHVSAAHTPDAICLELSRTHDNFNENDKWAAEAEPTHLSFYLQIVNSTKPKRDLINVISLVLGTQKINAISSAVVLLRYIQIQFTSVCPLQSMFSLLPATSASSWHCCINEQELVTF